MEVPDFTIKEDRCVEHHKQQSFIIAIEADRYCHYRPDKFVKEM